MKYKLLDTDGPGRIGKLGLNKASISSPNILFLSTKQFRAPKYADIILTNQNLSNKKPTLKISENLHETGKKQSKDLTISNFLFLPNDLTNKIHLQRIDQSKKQNLSTLILPAKQNLLEKAIQKNQAVFHIVSNAVQLFNRPSNFVQYLVTLRELIGYEKTIYLPAVANPSNLALLCYCGVDFLDSTAAIISAVNKKLFFPSGRINIEDMDEIPCSCPTCTGIDFNPKKMIFEKLIDHNYQMLVSELKRVKLAIKQNNLRNLVEIRVKAKSQLAAILRNLDYHHYPYLEKHLPVTGSSMINATCLETLMRPEIKRFQKRLIDRYSKPKSAKVLLVLPCSAKKPYSFSKSHMWFNRQVNQSKNPFIFHKLVITSPIGIVPHELELIYPASSYDIPVTGVWDENEKQMIINLLKKYLSKNNYEQVILHLPKGITSFIKDLFQKPVVTCKDHPVSDESLKELGFQLKKIGKKYKKNKKNTVKKEHLRCIAQYQFGDSIAKELLKNTVVKGNYPFYRILDKENRQLGMITEKRGYISLTFLGAERLKKFKEFQVEIYGDFTLEGSLFAPGVKAAEENIRKNDEVTILQNGEIVGVGKALMNGMEMKNRTHGEAVKTRHLK